MSFHVRVNSNNFLAVTLWCCCGCKLLLFRQEGRLTWELCAPDLDAQTHHWSTSRQKWEFWSSWMPCQCPFLTHNGVSTTSTLRWLTVRFWMLAHGTPLKRHRICASLHVKSCRIKADKQAASVLGQLALLPAPRISRLYPVTNSGNSRRTGCALGSQNGKTPSTEISLVGPRPKLGS